MENINELSFTEVCKRISDTYNGSSVITLKELENLFTKFTKQLFMGTFNINFEPMVKIVDSDEFSGCYNGLAAFKINRQSLKDFQRGKALALFETISHELCHFSQKRQFQNINIRNSFIEKDNFLKTVINDYYITNYDYVMKEVDASLSQQKDALEIMQNLGIKPTQEEIEISNIEKEEHQNNLTNNRIIDGRIENLDDAFEQRFQKCLPNMDDFDRSNFLEFNPCINLEYNIIDNKLVRKTKEELSDLYNNWQIGNIKLVGTPQEIDAYFIYNIRKFDNVEMDSVK